MKLNKVKMWMIDLKLIWYIYTYTSVFPNPANCFPCLPCGLLGGGFAADGLGICTTISSLSESYHDKWKYESQQRLLMFKKYQGYCPIASCLEFNNVHAVQLTVQLFEVISTQYHILICMMKMGSPTFFWKSVMTIRELISAVAESFVRPASLEIVHFLTYSTFWKRCLING